MTPVFAYYPMTELLLSELFLTQCGWESCENGHSYGPAVRDHFLIHFVSKGRGHFSKEEKTLRLFAGDGFVIYPGETTTYVADEEDPWEYYWVGFSGAKALTMLALSGVSRMRPVFHLERPVEEVAACIQAIHTHASFSSGGQMRALAGLLHFLSLVIDASADSEKPRANTIQNEYAATAIRLIQERHADGLTVDSLARAVGIDRSHLFRAFKTCLGVGPQQYIVAFRVKRACQLLLETAMSIQDISSYVGFSTPTHMGVAFRRLHGMSPGAYRSHATQETSRLP